MQNSLSGKEERPAEMSLKKYRTWTVHIS